MAELFAPEDYWNATDAQKRDICNGCGTKGLSGLITPDTLYGLSIDAACDIHDWMYVFGQTIADKEAADRTFLNNMLRIVEAHPRRLLRFLRRQRAMKYYSAVRDFGGPAFWAGKNAPAEMGVLAGPPGPGRHRP